jgi:aryl-alcohol dehydrogenase-like predicted oxidoreductase
MKYRPLGNTGFQVSEISFGTGDNAGLMVKGTPQEQTKAVARALELGVNYFDTAPAYGKGVAETNLGRTLRELGSSAWIATKVEVMPNDLDDIEAKIGRSLDRSLARLGVNTVDVLMIHNPPRLARNTSINVWTPLTPEDFLGPALRGLETARKAGKAKHFGFTCEGSQPAAVIPLLETGHFSVINVSYNLVHPAAGNTMPPGYRVFPDHDYTGIVTACGRTGVGAAIIRPMAGGALAPSVIAGGVTARHPTAGGMYSEQPQTFAPEAARGRAFGFLERPDRTLAKAAYTFVLAHPAVSTIVAGPSDTAQLEEAIACSGGPPLEDSELTRIRDVWARNFDLAS